MGPQETPSSHPACMSPATRPCPDQLGRLSWDSPAQPGCDLAGAECCSWNLVSTPSAARGSGGDLEAGVQHGHSEWGVPGGLDQLLSSSSCAGPVLREVLKPRFSQGQPPWCHQKGPPRMQSSRAKEKGIKKLGPLQGIITYNNKTYPHK